MNIARHVEHGRQAYGQRPALEFEGQVLSYAELDAAASQSAHLLAELGVGPGDRVALFLPNIAEFVIAYLAILKLGAIAVAVNARWRQAEVGFVLADSGAQAVITTRTLRGEIPDGALAAPGHVLIAEGEPGTDLPWQALRRGRPEELAAQELAPETPAAIVYTSGTTGAAKGATLSHGNVVFTMAAKQRYLELRSEDRLLLFLPLFHCFGQNAVLNAGLQAGATVVLQRTFELETALQAIAEQGISVFNAVPSIFLLLLNQVEPALLRRVRRWLSAAAKLPAEIEARWLEQVGTPIHQGYGLTETSPFAAYNHLERYKLGSIGVPIDQVEVKVVDVETGQELAAGLHGELLIRGPNVMLGYWNRPDETAAAVREGWFHSGDIGYRDAEGYFFLVDRLKDMINVSGLKVYPAEVENVLYRHPAVAECAVYGVEDLLAGERVKAHVVCQPGSAVTAAELIAFCRETLADYKAPSALELVGSIPKSPTGKILKRVLQEAERQAAQQAAAQQAAAQQAAAQQAAAQQAEPGPGETVRLQLSDYGDLEALQFVPVLRRPPGPGEVEVAVKAAGLNLRDVLNGLGLLREYYARSFGITRAEEVGLGLECAGVVAAVGEGVTGLAAGDRVMGISLAGRGGTFGSSVVLPAHAVAPIPAGMDDCAAATIPLAFLTAWYGLVELGGLQPGEQVLIHAAAGGVGQAAVQMAQAIGAEVIATASPAKWDFLRQQGVRHVLNSRTLDFAAGVLQITGGRGVDVVLNSLNGEFIPAGFAALARGGRFVEIGKLGAWSEGQAAQVRADAAYFAFDIGESIAQEPGLAVRLWSALEPRLAAGVLHPLPHVTFAAADAAGAFRTMQQAKHVGKIVLDFSTVPAAAAQQAGEGRPGLRQVLAALPAPERTVRLEAFLEHEIAGVLGLPRERKIERRLPLYDFGLGSLASVELRTRLGKALGANLHATLLFDYPTIEKLAAYLVQEVLQLAAPPAAAAPAPAAARTGTRQAARQAAALEGLSGRDLLAYIASKKGSNNG